VATPGQKMRALRESLQLTLRDVETASNKIALQHSNEEFAVPFSRLFGIEAKGVIPNIYRLYSLSIIYHNDLLELMCWYGVDLQSIPSDLKFGQIPVTHRLETDLASQSVQMPVELDPSFSPARTVNFTMLVRKWGSVPMAYLAGLSKENFLYAYVGTEDYTMYPMIMPGSFLQVDESRCDVLSHGWRSEHERPIYLIETRNDGFRVGWCSLAETYLIIHPHPLSSTVVKAYRHPQDAEVIGQVVAVTMRLVTPDDHVSEPGKRARKESSLSVLHTHPLASGEKQP
jgi:hypothetical protein